MSRVTKIVIEPGTVFGRLTVLALAPMGNGRRTRGSFMRAPTVMAELRAFDIRVTHIEKRLDQ